MLTARCRVTIAGMAETQEHTMVAPGNVDMAAMWAGEEGDDWTENADRYDASDRCISARFEAEVDIGATDHVLDVGCGTGKSTRRAAHRAASGSVLGIDLSSRMLDHARRQSAAEGLTNVRYVQGDAQVHDLEPARFDIAISAFGAMFFADPVAAFANIGRALRQGGRVASLSWQPFERNEWLTAIFGAVAAGRDLPAPPVGVPGPFGLADPDQIEDVLRHAGFGHVDLIPIDEPFWAGEDADEAFAFLAGGGIVQGLVEDLDGRARAGALERLRQVIEDHATDDGVLFGAATWLVTATH